MLSSDYYIAGTDVASDEVLASQLKNELKHRLEVFAGKGHVARAVTGFPIDELRTQGCSRGCQLRHMLRLVEHGPPWKARTVEEQVHGHLWPGWPLHERSSVDLNATMRATADQELKKAVPCLLENGATSMLWAAPEIWWTHAPSLGTTACMERGTASARGLPRGIVRKTSLRAAS